MPLVTDTLVLPTGLTYNQLNNNLTSQAAIMVTNGVPNDVLSNLDPFALIIFIPICDVFLYPAIRCAGWNFTPLKKISLRPALHLQAQPVRPFRVDVQGRQQ